MKKTVRRNLEKLILGDNDTFDKYYNGFIHIMESDDPELMLKELEGINGKYVAEWMIKVIDYYLDNRLPYIDNDFPKNTKKETVLKVLYSLDKKAKFIRSIFKKRLKSKPKITAPALALFCNIVHKEGIISGNSAVKISKAVCEKYKFTHTDRVRINFYNDITNKNARIIIEDILPTVDEKTAKIVKTHLETHTKIYH
jgi:hypothetical protein